MVSQTVRRTGSKVKQVKWLKSFIQPIDRRYNVYTETFCGGAALFLSLEPCRTEVLNDLDKQIYHLHKTLRDPLLARDLRELLANTAYSRDELEAVKENPDYSYTVQMARDFLVLSVMSMRAQGGTFDSSINRNGFIGRANYWYGYPDSIEDLNKRLRGAIIENRDALDCLKAFDMDNALHYVDPPYKGSEDRYANTVNHRELVEVLKELNGYVLLSGYANETYEDLLEPDGWVKHTQKSYAEGGYQREECVWLNPKLANAQNATQQERLFI